MINIQKQLQELFGGACYALCISYLSGKNDTEELSKDVLLGWSKGWIEDDGFVAKPHLFYNYCFGENLARDVEIRPYVTQPFDQIVCWKWGKKTHFVVMRDDKVVFDPSGDSNTVKNGKPDSIREFKC